MSSVENLDIETNNYLTKPHVVEKMIEETGLKVLDIHHGEYPLYLSTADGLHGAAFDVVTLPIKKELVDLMNTGKRPYVFEDARTEFDDIVTQGHLIKTDHQGRLVVENNRYKVIAARRQYEDVDRERDIKKTKAKIPQIPKLGLVEPDVETVKDMVNQFNTLLHDNLAQVPNSPWKYMLDSVKRDIKVTAGNDSVNILDLASSPNNATKIVAEEIPKADLYCVDFSSDAVEEIKSFASEKKLLHVTPNIVKDHQDLSAYETSSMDIVTCCFGLTRFSNPESILKEVHRVLKPGGSFIATTWESIAFERIGDVILSNVLIAKEPHISTPVSNLTSLSAPREMERMVNSCDLEIVQVQHHEFPFTLGKDDNDEKEAFDNAIISIRHLLKQLEENGMNPNAFNDARRVYDKMLSDHQLMWKDELGNIKTVRNRYKFLIARRKFENTDRVLDKKMK